MDDLIPVALRSIVPKVGDIWVWEPLKPDACQTVRVTEVVWNGDEVMVKSSLIDGTFTYWNELGRWVEATVLVTPAEG